ncbi:centrosome-associated protein 350 isoform X2 [Lepisosteus oculatus]|nr:PREDICTED: centrosome-associated protein 350-like isoform X2 [Lepisosteus oculatus]
MVFCVFWSMLDWTFRGLICFWRFMWVTPFQAITSSYLSKKRKIVDFTVHSPKLEKTDTEVSEETSNLHDCSNLVRKRLSKAESEIQLLKSQISKEKAVWEKRFLELQRKQLELRDQLISEILARNGALFEDDISGFIESDITTSKSDLENHCMLDACASEEPLPHHQRKTDVILLKSENLSASSKRDLSGSLLSWSSSNSSRPSSSTSRNSSLVTTRSNTKPYRVFVPHSHLDLQIGHRVRLLLPSGRINTGTIQYLGYLSGMQDFCVGVELETPEYGQHDGVYEGHCYFKCKPGHGVFVNFNKLLMAWE